MKHRDSIFASLALALSVVVMAGLVGSGEYAHAAGAEARGYQALFHVLADQECEAPQAGAAANATLVAANEVSE